MASLEFFYNKIGFIWVETEQYTDPSDSDQQATCRLLTRLWLLGLRMKQKKLRPSFFFPSLEDAIWAIVLSDFHLSLPAFLFVAVSPLFVAVSNLSVVIRLELMSLRSERLRRRSGSFSDFRLSSPAFLSKLSVAIQLEVASLRSGQL